MANVVSGNPLVLDTVGSVSPFQNSEVRIRSIQYIDYAIATDVVQINDAEGRIVWRGAGNASLSPVITEELGWVKGLVVNTLNAPGRILVYL